jgi:tetratricopeptide (TPR) repeat protein
VLADLYAELGRQDQARAEFERFAGGDFTGLPFNDEWLLGMTLLADVCAALGDVPRAGRLYELLLPYRELHAVGQVEISFGAVARALGQLAATAGRFEQATRHVEAAIQLNQRSGARPWTAHTRHDYARTLIARGDRQKAHQQLAQALATYRELGMDRWADKALSRAARHCQSEPASHRAVAPTCRQSGRLCAMVHDDRAVCCAEVIGTRAGPRGGRVR